MNTEQTLTLTRATAEDKTYIARLNFLTDTFGDEHGVLEDDFDEEFDYYVTEWTPEQGAIIAWQGKIPAGGAWLRWGNAERHGFGHYEDGTPEVALAVEGRYKGRGIGTKLLDAAAELAKEMGAPGISLAVHPDNERAHGLYLHLGYEPTGITRHDHPVLVRRFD